MRPGAYDRPACVGRRRHRAPNRGDDTDSGRTSRVKSPPVELAPPGHARDNPVCFRYRRHVTPKRSDGMRSDFRRALRANASASRVHAARPGTCGKTHGLLASPARGAERRQAERTAARGTLRARTSVAPGAARRAAGACGKPECLPVRRHVAKARRRHTEAIPDVPAGPVNHALCTPPCAAYRSVSGTVVAWCRTVATALGRFGALRRLRAALAHETARLALHTFRRVHWLGECAPTTERL